MSVDAVYRRGAGGAHLRSISTEEKPMEKTSAERMNPDLRSERLEVIVRGVLQSSLWTPRRIARAV